MVKMDDLNKTYEEIIAFIKSKGIRIFPKKVDFNITSIKIDNTYNLKLCQRNNGNLE